MDSGMQTIGPMAPVDLGATRTVIEAGVTYTYRRQAGAQFATLSAALSADNAGTGPVITVWIPKADSVWSDFDAGSFCYSVRASFALLAKIVA